MYLREPQSPHLKEFPEVPEVKVLSFSSQTDTGWGMLVRLPFDSIPPAELAELLLELLELPTPVALIGRKKWVKLVYMAD